MAIALKRAYDAPKRTDGFRVLVDGLWPRGVKKDEAQIDLWARDLAPSDELRKWFHAHPVQWPAFRKRYMAELHDDEGANTALEELHAITRAKRTVTLVYASRDALHNNAVILKELLDGVRKPPSSTGPAREVAASKRARARR